MCGQAMVDVLGPQLHNAEAERDMATIALEDTNSQLVTLQASLIDEQKLRHQVSAPLIGETD